MTLKDKMSNSVVSSQIEKRRKREEAGESYNKL